MAVDSYGISDREANVLSALNDLCTLVFIAEAGVKLQRAESKEARGRMSPARQRSSPARQRSSASDEAASPS